MYLRIGIDTLRGQITPSVNTRPERRGVGGVLPNTKPETFTRHYNMYIYACTHLIDLYPYPDRYLPSSIM